jgi:glyoxylase-like metal-dependent hydrolase (beta-lactamase superfamily II)
LRGRRPGSGEPMLERNVAPGIHRVEDANVNWYLVEADDGLTVIDAGVPESWSSLQQALRELGRSPGDVKAVVLTHAHFDHIGFAERARTELGVPIYVHENDVPLARRPLQYAHEHSRTRYLLTRPKALPIMLGFVRARAFWPRPVAVVSRYVNGTLPLPGSPEVVFTPGHTLGHCSLSFPDRDAVIAGDSLVMLDPYTAAVGPRIVAGAATADSERALDSLDALAATGAGTLLTGHGEPWRNGAAAAVAHARRVGAS